MSGTNKAGAITLEPVSDLNSPEGLVREVGTISGLFRDLVARGGIVYDAEGRAAVKNSEEVAQLRAREEDLLVRFGNLEIIVKANASTRFGAGNESDAAIVSKAAMILNVPEDLKGVNRTYFNLIALNAEELAGAASLGDRHVPGLRGEVQRFAADPKNAPHLRNVRRFHHLNDRLVLKFEWLYQDGKTNWAKSINSRIEGMMTLAEWKEYEKLGDDFLRAMDETTGSKGLSLVPFLLSASFQEKVEEYGKVAPLFGRFVMKSKTFDWPLLSGHVTAKKVAEGTGDHATATNPLIAGTNATWALPRWTAQGLKGICYASTEVEEDSVVPALPFLENDGAAALAIGEENATINGELDANTMDGATFTPTGDQRQLFTGLRFRAIMTGSYPAKVDALNGTLSNTLCIRVQKLMGAWGVRPDATAWISGFTAYHQARLMAQYQTIDKIGDKASIVRGQVGVIEGSKHVLSEHVVDLNASGRYDGTTTDRGTLLCVRTDRALYGDRRAPTVDFSEHAAFADDQIAVRFTRREDFQFIDAPSATVTPVGIIYNIAQPA